MLASKNLNITVLDGIWTVKMLSRQGGIMVLLSGEMSSVPLGKKRIHVGENPSATLRAHPEPEQCVGIAGTAMLAVPWSADQPRSTTNEMLGLLCAASLAAEHGGAACKGSATPTSDGQQEAAGADVTAEPEAPGLPQGARVLGFDRHHLERLSASGHELLLLNEDWTVRFGVSTSFLGRKSASLIGHSLLLSCHPLERAELEQRAAALPFANKRERAGETRVQQAQVRHRMYTRGEGGGMAELMVVSSITAISAPERCLLLSTKVDR